MIEDMGAGETEANSNCDYKKLPKLIRLFD